MSDTQPKTSITKHTMISLGLALALLTSVGAWLRQDGYRAAQSEALTARVAKLEEDKAKIDAMSGDVAVAKRDIGSINETLTSMKTDIREIKNQQLADRK